MKKFFKDFADNIRSAAIKISKALTPGKETVTGGGLGIIVVAALTLIIPLSGMIKYTGIYAGLTMIVAVLLALALTALLADLVLNMAMKEKGNSERGNEEISNRELTGIDFSIELADEKGRTISLPLESCSLLQPRMKKQMIKMAFMRTAPKSETVFSFFYFKIDELSGMNSEFNPENIEKISLVFNRTESSVIILNNIGLMPWY